MQLNLSGKQGRNYKMNNKKRKLDIIKKSFGISREAEPFLRDKEDRDL